ncbi:hypothetical protein [Ferrimonas balearica]|uniref:hypothetical protein n=1 Tax=Ferrimonas balearica TaxID=44012 RepID=UPI001C99B362|nr:hypothetical protein [Ferrimonas balearica]MBY5991620.1 hypothetical protein [Ferrimonas balearica]
MQKLDVIAVLKEAWSLTRQGLQPMLGASLLTFAIVMACAIFLIQLVAGWQGLDLADEAQLQQAMQPTQLLLVLILAPFEAALAYMGWRRATAQPTQLSMLFRGWAMALPLSLIALLTAVLVQIGLVLLIIPGVYLMAVLSQANLYYLFHRGSPVKAMIESAKVVHGQLFAVITLYSAMIAVLMISLIPMGLGLIITIPLFFHMKGVLFRELFPELSPAAQEAETPDERPSSNGHFEA